MPASFLSPSYFSTATALNRVSINAENLAIELPALFQDGSEGNLNASWLPSSDAVKWAGEFANKAFREQNRLAIPQRAKSPWYAVKPSPETKAWPANATSLKFFDVSTKGEAKQKEFTGGVSIPGHPRLAVEISDTHNGRLALRKGGLSSETELTPDGARTTNAVISVSEAGLIQFVRGAGILHSLVPNWFYRLFPRALMRSAAELIIKEITDDRVEFKKGASKNGIFGPSIGAYTAKGTRNAPQNPFLAGWLNLNGQENAADALVQREDDLGRIQYNIKINNPHPNSPLLYLTGRNQELVRIAEGKKNTLVPAKGLPFWSTGFLRRMFFHV